MDYFHFVSLVLILFSVKVEFLLGAEGLSRALDLSWRPLSHSPYQQQFFQDNAPPALITYSHFNSANKDEIVEAAKHNALLLKKFKEIANHPITSYSDPYQMYSQTPSPQSKLTTTYQNIKPQPQHIVSAASNHVLSRAPFPMKSVPLYQTKLTFLGKPDVNAIYHQNSIHQTAPGTTPKVAGFTKEFGRVNLHYHHPSITSSLSTSTKRIPVFSSSVTPQPGGFHSGSKIHPVMNKFQAHMSLASQGHHHKLKQNFAFSPPSQLMSNYANFGPATSNPFWHNNFGKQNAMHHHLHDFHPSYHLSSGPEASQMTQQQYQNLQQQLHIQQQQYQNQQLEQNNQNQNYNQQIHLQNQPSIHPSVITPFLDQVHKKQKEAAAAEQKNSQKQSQESSNENNGSFEIINDVFSKNLVPPPPSVPQNFGVKKQTKEEKLNKYNLAMQSPLQDASRFNYENVISTAVTPTPYEPQRFKPSASDNTYMTTDKPKVFGNLNRPRDNVYKHHKLLHPSYTGNGKRKPSPSAPEKPFLPTPYKPEKESDEIKIVDNFEPQHSFFTIEDAVTPKLLSYHVVKSHIPVDEHPETFTFSYPEKVEAESTKLTLTTPSVATTVEQQTQKPRQKLRRRKQKPKQSVNVEEPKREEIHEKPTVKPNILRGSIRNVDSQPQQDDFRTKKRVSSVRNKITFSSPAATVKPSTEEVKHEEITIAHHYTTEIPTSAKAEEVSEQPENVKRRVRLRYKNKLRQDFSSVDANEFKLKTPLRISEAESENIPVKQLTENSELNIGTEESTFNETRSTLKLPNLKLRNEVLTTFTPIVESLTSVSPSETTAPSAQENNIHNKIVNRPRFSIKEIKRKQLSSASAATTSISTTTTTAKPDGQRFNRLRVSLNRKRNETTDSSEDLEPPKRKFSSSRPTATASTTDTTQTSFKRGTLPKRTFPPRNFTKPIATTESENTTSMKPSTKSLANVNTNRTIPSLRSRIQTYKKKEAMADLDETTAIPQKKIDLISEAAETIEEAPTTTTSTELPPVKHETSIMKIAKTPSTINVVKSTTSNSIDEANETSRSDFDLTGSPSEHSQRVAELTISGNDNYSFKSANIGPLSRRIPNYFTISTDDPILPIQAFFPQIKANEETLFDT